MSKVRFPLNQIIKIQICQAKVAKMTNLIGFICVQKYIGVSNLATDAARPKSRWMGVLLPGGLKWASGG